MLENKIITDDKQIRIVLYIYIFCCYLKHVNFFDSDTKDIEIKLKYIHIIYFLICYIIYIL